MKQSITRARSAYTELSRIVLLGASLTLLSSCFPQALQQKGAEVVSSFSFGGGSALKSALAVEAGADQELILPNRVAQLSALVVGEASQVSWRQVSGAGSVVFSSGNAAQTYATFPSAGAYELQVRVIGPKGSATDTLRIRITSPSSGATFALPAENQGKWRPGIDVGVDGGIAQYLAGGVKDRAVTGNVINLVTQHGADATGARDVSEAVKAALAAASPGDVIYFPPGTYLFESGFIYSGYKDRITIRGAGVGVTTLRTSTSQPVFIFNDPGSPSGTAVQEITGPKTKGLATITVADTSGYTVGRRAVVFYENEENSARVIAGANPVWSSAGFPNARAVTVVITGVTSTTLSIDPPLVADGTNLKTYIGTHPGAVRGTDEWGFEDFSVSFDPARHPSQFAIINASTGTWVHNVHFTNFSRNQANGSCIKMSACYKCEIRKNRFTALPGSSSDGAIETAGNSNSMIIDNIIEGSFGNGIYDSGNSTQNYIAYNYVRGSGLTIFHNAHPSLNLLEGNVASHHQSDGYHGSSSNNTLYRNWLYSSSGVVLNRFKRDYVMAGNVFGEDGVTSFNGISWGNPNIGNGAANGFAGPLGTSRRAGAVDYSQPGYGFNSYVIQPSDISVGDFWSDWNVTGTLTTRISDTQGVFAMSGGNWFTGASPTGASGIIATLHWNGKAQRVGGGTVVAVSGLNVTLSFTAGTLPAVGTTVAAYFGPAGWQERDLDVEASSTLVSNYASKVSGGSIIDPTPSALPASMAYTAKPDWWNADGFTGIWPPVDPQAPVFSPSIIPAGARYLDGQ